MLPIRIGEPKLAEGDPFVLEGLGDRVDVGDVERPARTQEVSDDPGPAPDVGQPAEDAARRVDDVEITLQRRRQVVQVRRTNRAPGKPVVRQERAS
jgi:hypothetical protein